MDTLLTPKDIVAIYRLRDTKALYNLLYNSPEAVAKPFRVGRLLRWTHASVDAHIAQLLNGESSEPASR